MFQTRTVSVRDLIALAKIVHAAHDQDEDWMQCRCHSCRTLALMVYPDRYVGQPVFQVFYPSSPEA